MVVVRFFEEKKFLGPRKGCLAQEFSKEVLARTLATPYISNLEACGKFLGYICSRTVGLNG